MAEQRIELTADQIAQLTKNGVFPNAYKDESHRWCIPTDDIDVFIGSRLRRKRRL